MYSLEPGPCTVSVLDFRPLPNPPACPPQTPLYSASLRLCSILKEVCLGKAKPPGGSGKLRRSQHHRLFRDKPFSCEARDVQNGVASGETEKIRKSSLKMWNIYGTYNVYSALGGKDRHTMRGESDENYKETCGIYMEHTPCGGESDENYKEICATKDTHESEGVKIRIDG